MLLRLQPEALMELVSQKLASYLFHGERELKSSLQMLMLFSEFSHRGTTKKDFFFFCVCV